LELALRFLGSLKEITNMKNPKWSRDELILALELYLRVNPIHTSEKNPEITALSDLLNSLPIHPQAQHGHKFRNPNGVYMKLCNFLRLDPGYSGSGLKRGGKMEEVVWKEFSGDPERLKATAGAIKSIGNIVPQPLDFEEHAIEEDEEFPEGRLLTQLHKRRERNPKAVRRKKKKVLKETGKLACEVCGFDFADVYGQIGCGFAECHHRMPLSVLDGRKAIKISELAIVCSNCCQ
jgi:5-methylcytosine-specific restriction protein A